MSDIPRDPIGAADSYHANITINGQADAANQRITDALGTRDTQPEPGGEEDSDSKKAT